MTMDIEVLGLDAQESTAYDAVDYLFWMNSETYGKPTLLSPGDDHVEGPKRILYVNVAGVAAVYVDKKS